MTLLGSFLRDEKGQTTVEYILILSVVVVGSIALVKTMMGAMDRGVLRLGATLEKDLKTGRMPVDAWSK